MKILIYYTFGEGKKANAILDFVLSSFQASFSFLPVGESYRMIRIVSESKTR